LSESQLANIKELRDGYRILAMKSSDNTFIKEAASKANINEIECKEKILQFLENCNMVIKNLKRGPYPKTTFFGLEMTPTII
jgi:hypothetical protein